MYRTSAMSFKSLEYLINFYFTVPYLIFIFYQRKSNAQPNNILWHSRTVNDLGYQMSDLLYWLSRSDSYYRKFPIISLR